MYCYVSKSPVFRLQRESAKSPLAPSVLDLYGLSNPLHYCPIELKSKFDQIPGEHLESFQCNVGASQPSLAGHMPGNVLLEKAFLASHCLNNNELSIHVWRQILRLCHTPQIDLSFQLSARKCEIFFFDSNACRNGATTHFVEWILQSKTCYKFMETGFLTKDN